MDGIIGAQSHPATFEGSIIIILKHCLTAEERVVLLLSRPFLSEKTLKKELSSSIKLNNNLDFNRIYDLALKNGVAGFVHKNTKSISFFPEKIKVELQKNYRQISFRNLHQLSATISVLRLLSDNNISAMPLKGSAASDLLFNDLGVYPSGDIDILVHPSELSEAKIILCSKGGYQKVDEIDENDLINDHYHLLLKNNRYLLEVHWNLVKRYFKIPADFWWEETKSTTWHDSTVTELSVERYILYTVFRLFDHCFSPLRFFVLIGGIIDHNAHLLDWNKLMDYAEQYRMKRLTLFVLQLLKEILNTNVPADIINKKVIGYKYYKALILSGLFSGVNKQHLRMMVYSSLLDDSLFYFRVLLRRVFPTEGELRLRYNLPPDSKKMYLYYLLNPFLLFFKKE